MSMDTIERLTSTIRQATDYQINKEILREKILTDRHIAYNGGLFLVTPELIAFLATWETDQVYLEDTYHNPIEVDRTELLTLAREHYQQIMNTWHQQHAELRRLRKI